MKEKDDLQKRLESDIELYEFMLKDELRRTKSMAIKFSVALGIVAAGIILTSFLAEDEVDEDNEQKKEQIGGLNLGAILIGSVTPWVIKFIKDEFSKP